MNKTLETQTSDAFHEHNIRFRAGTGDWAAFNASEYSLDDVYRAAEQWREKLDGVEEGWLCWSVDPDWNRIQQRLVLSVGWTPVVGFDPRTPRPQAEPGAVIIDFNNAFNFQTMWFHFPLEFAFLFSTRLAFWHADLLLHPAKMQYISDLFRTLPQGATAAVKLARLFRRHFDFRYRRYWELLGCTTQQASKDQFDNGAGWWMNFAHHPNSTLVRRRWFGQKPYWDSGAGIWHWNKKLKGPVTPILEREVSDGHFTSINNKDYVFLEGTRWTRNLGADLRYNYDLRSACEKMGLGNYL
ncbi:MAG: hypothetical protein ACU84H_17030 [Gammaproteobacteria bacterium]